MSRYSRELGVAAVLAAILLLLAIRAPAFYQSQPLLSLATREAPVLLVACGIAVVILCRQIDISVGSQFAICGVVAGLLAGAGWPLALAALGAIVTGAVMGAFNGLLIAFVGLPSIVVTLATMVMWREGLRWIRQGQFVDLPDGMQWFGLAQTAGQWIIVVAALALAGVLAWSLRGLAAGRWFYAVGSDAEAARLAGIPARTVTFAAFVLVGALAGLAAMLNVMQSPQIDPKSGSGLELKVIAAAVVGGVSIKGGRGRIVGVFVGLLLLACISPALTHLHIEAFWEKAIQGAIILIAVVSEGLRNRRAGKEGA
jgi:rhamnose transport system permease protein